MLVSSPSWLVILTFPLTLFGILTGVLISEVAYRVYLSAIEAPGRFVRLMPGPIGVYDKPFWVYNEEFGYVYPKGEAVHNSSIDGEKVIACSVWRDFNKYGNIGPIDGEYDSADLKILVFGDSFSVTMQDGQTWVSVLQQKLTDRLGRKVHVVNFGRDGCGVLQMFILAFYPEIKAGQEFIMNYTEAALADSLRQLTGRDIHETTKYIRMPVEHPERMNLSEDNHHPSRWGMELYAEAVADMLVRNGYVKEGPRSDARPTQLQTKPVRAMHRRDS